MLWCSAAPPARAADEPPKPVLKVEVTADMLALRATVRTDITADQWQWRVLPRSAEDQVAWSNCPAPPIEGVLKLATPLPAGGWYRLEVRALQGGTSVREAGVTRPEPPSLELATPERIAALAEPQRAAWRAYLEASMEAATYERAVLTAECQEARARVSKPAPTGASEFEISTKVDPSWFGTPEAGQLATVVLSYQTPTGGWSKAVDYSRGPRPKGTHWTTQSGAGWHYCGTLDNHSTTQQIRFLAQVYLATQRTDCRKGVERGLAWLLQAQFPNGGWPQVYPLEPGYHEAITLNDDAMMHALELLRAAGAGEEPYAFLEERTRTRAQAAHERGIACLLACQVKIQGQRTVWCAQHDPVNLAPVAARLKEPPSLSGAESANLLRFLMRQGPVTAPVREAVEDAVAWLQTHQVKGVRKVKTPDGKTDYLEDPTATDVLWARFYDLESGQPIFAGAQDGKIYPTYHEMARHNKVAYDYFVTKPADVVTKELERWKKRLARETRS